MMKLHELPVGQEPEVGKVYLTPCVDMRGMKLDNVVLMNFAAQRDKLVAIPLLGFPHSDPEFREAGGELPHVHIDVRFLTEWECVQLWREFPKALNNPSFVRFPVLPNSADDPLPPPHLHAKMCMRNIGDFRTIRLGLFDDYDEFKEKMSVYTIDLGNPVCPHHGTPLTGQPVRDGIVTCPLHGSTWCALTGRHVKKGKINASQQDTVKC